MLAERLETFANTQNYTMKYLIAVVSTLLPFIQFAQEKGMDQKIDEGFGWATGWFVNLIFYQIPFTEDIKVYWVLFPLIIGALLLQVMHGQTSHLKNQHR